MDILQVKNISFAYPESDNGAVSEVSFSVAEGEFVVLCGESGCGKSTLLKLLKHEVSPYGKFNGEIYYCGVEQSKLDKRQAASEIGLVLQNPDSQIVTDKVWHELAFGLESLGVENSVIRRRVAEMASYFGIEDWFHKNVNELSGGQKQMLNLASVMVMQPKVLLLDEPTAQLDPIAAAGFIGTLHKLNRELGLTILLVEHRLEEAFGIADRVFLMDSGKLLFAESPRKLSRYFVLNPSHPMVAGLPAAVRIYEALQRDGMAQKDMVAQMDMVTQMDMVSQKEGMVQNDESCPLTVKEGREFIMTHYDNKVLRLENDVVRSNASDATQCVLELKDVWFRYERDSLDVLKGVSLKVYKGENLCILGGNGVGKTTMLGVMSGLLTAYRGKVLVAGKDIRKLSQKELYQENIAVLPQKPQTVFLENTVEEDLTEVCKAMGLKRDEAKNQISNVAAMLGIGHRLNMHPYDLSGGEQQKAALAKMLLLKPKLLMLDEPTKGIDAHSKQVLAGILKRLKEEGITIITVTHDVEFAAENADRCGLCFDGELVCVDEPRTFFAGNNFYTTAANRMVRGYYKDVVLCEDVIKLCRINGKKAGEGLGSIDSRKGVTGAE